MQALTKITAEERRNFPQSDISKLFIACASLVRTTPSLIFAPQIDLKIFVHSPSASVMQMVAALIPWCNRRARWHLL